MEESVIQKLLATAAVGALVGARVYPHRRPQAGALPVVTLHRISGAPLYTNDGETGLAEARLQIDCWDDTYAGAKAVARAVTDALSGFVGTQDATAFRFFYLDTERDNQESGSNTTEYLFRTSLDFQVMFDN